MDGVISFFIFLQKKHLKEGSVIDRKYYMMYFDRHHDDEEVIKRFYTFGELLDALAPLMPAHEEAPGGLVYSIPDRMLYYYPYRERAFDIIAELFVEENKRRTRPLTEKELSRLAKKFKFEIMTDNYGLGID